MLVGNNLVQFGCFAIVDFLHQGARPPPDAGRDVGGHKISFADQISASADFLTCYGFISGPIRWCGPDVVVSCYFFRQRARSPANTNGLKRSRRIRPKPGQIEAMVAFM